MAVYASVIAVVAIAEAAKSGFVHALAIPVIAGLQNHLMILMHEGAHCHVVPRSRRLNDLVTDIFCGIPLFGLVRTYRHFHLEHHRHQGQADRDPEIGFYKEQGYTFEPLGRMALARMLFLDLCGYHFLQFLVSYGRYLHGEIRAGRMQGYSVRDRFLTVALWGLALGLAARLGALDDLLFYWILPQATLLFAFLKLQGYGEHLGMQTLTHDLGPFSKFFIYPLNSHLHLEHHLQPGIPWYRLGSVRRRLEDSPQFQDLLRTSRTSRYLPCTK